MNNAQIAWSLGQIEAEQKLKQLQELDKFYKELDTKQETKHVQGNKRSKKG